MSNSTLSDSQLQSLVPKFVLYAIQGSLITVVNLPVVLAILRYDFLRDKKEYLVIGFLAMVDLLYGIGFIVAGVGRNVLIMRNQVNQLVTSWDCIWAPWNWFFLAVGHIHGLSLMAVSLDRLLMIFFPLQYIGWGRRYVFMLLVLVVMPFAIPLLMVLVWIAMNRNSLPVNKPGLCYTTWVYNVVKEHYDFYYITKTVTSWLSVLLYVVIAMKMKHQQQVVAPSLSTQAAQLELKRQRKFTVTMGMSCLCTFIFWVIPKHVNQFLLLIDDSNEFVANMIPLFGILSAFNPTVNALFYYKRQRDIRVSVTCMLSCKKPTSAMLNDTLHASSTGGRLPTNVRSRPACVRT